MAPYRPLKAWRHSQRLAVECSKAARDFPDYEQAALADQLRRAAYRLPSTIAQAGASRGTATYRDLLAAARAAHAEVVTILEVAKDLGYIELVRYARLDALADEAGKTIYGLLRKAGGGDIALSSARPPTP